MEVEKPPVWAFLFPGHAIDVTIDVAVRVSGTQVQFPHLQVLNSSRQEPLRSSRPQRARCSRRPKGERCTTAAGAAGGVGGGAPARHGGGGREVFLWMWVKGRYLG